MASLEEEIMAGLFGSNVAPGAEEQRRRRGGPGAGGYEGIGGGAVVPGMMLPYLQGLPTYDYSGPMARDFAGGGRGLAAMLAGDEPGRGRGPSPALRHFMNQGFDVFPRGDETRNPI